MLDPPPFPLTITPGFIADSNKTLEVHCRDRLFQDVAVFNATDRQELFRGTGKGIKSWSFRRSLIGPNDKHLLDLRHYSLDVKNRWIVEDPKEKKLASIEHVNQITKAHSAVDATIFGGREGRDVVLEMRPLDRSALTTELNLKGATIARISLIGDNDIIFNEARGKDRSVWRVEVAEGADMALVRFLCPCFVRMMLMKVQVTVMVLVRAEMAHVWRQ